MGAHPFLTLTLFIAMFERDHGPLEYQLAYGAAMQHLHAALPRHRHLSMRAALLRAYGAAARARPNDPIPSPRPGNLVEVTAAPDRAAGPALRQRHVLLRAAAAAVRARGAGGRRGRESPISPPGTRVWFATSAGMEPGDGSLAELCAVPAADLVPIDADVPDAAVAAIGTSGIAAWMALTWRARLQPGERVVVLGAGGAVGQVGDRPPPGTRRRPGGRGVPVGSAAAERAGRPAPTRWSCCNRPTTGPR